MLMPSQAIRWNTPAMPLSDVAIRKAKPAAKPYKLADGAGMFP